VSGRLLTPWWRDRQPAAIATHLPGDVAPTPILDWRTANVRNLIDQVQQESGSEIEVLRLAHAVIATRVAPVYALDEMQPVSKTLAREQGSCSQRLALLEAVARGVGIPTRVLGLLVEGRFWYPRFPRLKVLLPNEVVLAWPEFLLDGTWVGVSELFGSLKELERADATGFVNREGGETLFDALAKTAVDWEGVTSDGGACSSCDLSSSVVARLGRFASRDELFARYGQTLSLPVRLIVGPVLGRRSAR